MLQNLDLFEHHAQPVKSLQIFSKIQKKSKILHNSGPKYFGKGIFSLYIHIHTTSLQGKKIVLLHAMHCLSFFVFILANVYGGLAE